ncbi:MAG: Nramp family divalent metal transporter [Pseudomonadota bacterium]
MKLAVGPGALVAAAFIGPGTVTTATLAGANFGFALVWTLVFATLAAIVLQDMAARLGSGARLGLGEALSAEGAPALVRYGAAALILAALALGNAAYEAGNIAGGALGARAVFEGADRRGTVLIIGVLAGTALTFGRYRTIERLLVSLVLVMSLAFAASAILARPDLGALVAGLVPRVPEGGLLTALALIGTTVVPYNLFLHAAAARERFAGDGAVSAARTDAAVSISFGGLVSILIVATAAATLFGTGAAIESAADMARAAEPALGPAARYLIGTGLFAAGLTSAVTAPLATAYAVTELARPKDEPRRRLLFRGTALLILAIGCATALLDIRPVTLILIAQAANGLLLPVVAGFLLWAMNRRALLGVHANGPLANLFGGAVVLFAALLGFRALLRALGFAP